MESFTCLLWHPLFLSLATSFWSLSNDVASLLPFSHGDLGIMFFLPYFVFPICQLEEGHSVSTLFIIWYQLNIEYNPGVSKEGGRMVETHMTGVPTDSLVSYPLDCAPWSWTHDPSLSPPLLLLWGVFRHNREAGRRSSSYLMGASLRPLTASDLHPPANPWEQS